MCVNGLMYIYLYVCVFVWVDVGVGEWVGGVCTVFFY
jgi:hypothetical protein